MEATAMAASWSSGLGEWMRTRNSTNDMIVTTSTKMPVKRPLFALVQSTLKCRGEKLSFSRKRIQFFLKSGRKMLLSMKIWMKIPVVVSCFQVDLIRRES